MCLKTEAGLVQSVGKIRLTKPKNIPEFLQDFHYVIFKEENAILGMNFHSVCIDLEVESRGTSPTESFKGLERAINSLIKVTLEHFKDDEKAYFALSEQKRNRDETRELIYRVYNEVLAHNETILYARLRPQYKSLYKSVFSKLQDEDLLYKYSNFYAHAYSEEDIENLYKPKKLSDDKIKQIFALNYLLLHNKRVMA